MLVHSSGQALTGEGFAGLFCSLTIRHCFTIPEPDIVRRDL